MFTVLLYYKYVDLAYPQEVRDWQFALCEKLDLKGRILIAAEGINGTVCGEPEDIEEYKRITAEDSRFTDVIFKESSADEQVFPKLRVVVREEIVTLGTGDAVSAAAGGEHLRPDQLNALLHSGEEFYLFDARNNYESVVGKFRNAITPDIHNFRELPEKLKEYEFLKTKKIVTYCTGGVRCEKFSALMKKEGFENVYQLDGGIVTYGEQFPDDGYEGKCYVFDKRISVAINTPQKEVLVSRCVHCATPTARMINCSDVLCNKQIVCCSDCDQKFRGGCSEVCGSRSRYTA
ncbi:MAG: rhodanese-related sulfurtransferase [bacterium]|nr:rhodanese-related sulfurtransferase [bacterium]